MKQIQLRITGMHCGHCLHAVREALAKVPGARIDDLQIGSATVSIDENAAGVSALVDAVYDAGYEAEAVTA